MRLGWALAIAAAVLLVGASFAIYWYTKSVQDWYDRPIFLEDAVIVTVSQNQNFDRVSRVLLEHGLIDDLLKFEIVARLEGATTKLHVGEYRYEGSVSPRDVLQKIVIGDAFEYRIRIEEGKPFFHLRRVLAETDGITDDIHEVDDESIMDLLDVRISRETGEPLTYIEGLFLPETYNFRRHDKASTVLQRAHDALADSLAVAWLHRNELCTAETQYELLIVASLIEKETSRTGDRPHVSGVIHRRLQADMRLQIDPTVIYALGESFDGNLRRRDLRMEHPFNTYINYGLPPSPIASVSVESMEAAAQPAGGNSYYFVARGDGTTQFSATLAEHNAAVRKYQKR